MEQTTNYRKGMKFQSKVEETDGAFGNTMPGNPNEYFVVGVKQNGEVAHSCGLKAGKDYEFRIIDVDPITGLIVVKPIQRSLTELAKETEDFTSSARTVKSSKELAESYLGVSSHLEDYVYSDEKEIGVLAKFLSRIESAFQEANERIDEPRRIEVIRKSWLEHLVIVPGEAQYLDRMREISGKFLKQTSRVYFNVEPNLAELAEHPERTFVGKLDNTIVACLSYAQPEKIENKALRLENIGTDPIKPALVNLFLRKALDQLPGKLFYVALTTQANFKLFEEIGFLSGANLTLTDPQKKVLDAYKLYRFER